MRLERRELRRKLKTFGPDSRSLASFIIRTNGRKLCGYFYARLGIYQSDCNRDRRILSNLSSGLISGKQSQNMVFLRNSCLVCFWCIYLCFSDLIYFFFVVSFFLVIKYFLLESVFSVFFVVIDSIMVFFFYWLL